MSGVLALVSLDGRPVPRDLAQAQLDAIRHRGDGEPELWLGEGVALGQAFRPTTPEAEREVLPLVDASGRYHLVWDGRIDNREELARAFAWKGERAREATDADYVLEAYVRWGDACVTRLLGDWAIVIWDSTARRLFAAKDPMGFRTLFYAQHDGLFAIGSEPLQVLQPSWLPPRPDYEYARQFAAQALPVRQQSCYAGLRELWGGDAVAVARGVVTNSTFWTAPRLRDLGRRTPRDYVEEFAELFDQSVRARVRSRKPVGVYFSGGLDSSYVLAVAAKHAPVIALSTYAEGSAWDERDYQRMLVERLGVPWRLINIADELALDPNQLPEWFDQANVPPQTPMWRAQALDAAAAGVQVILGGEGGDEWLTGPPEAAASALLAGRWHDAWRLAAMSGHDEPRFRALLRQCYRGLVPEERQRQARRLTGRWVGSTFIPLVRDPSAAWEPRFDPPLWRHEQRVQVMWRAIQMLRDHHGWRARHLLLPAALEGRSPFYSLPLVEFLASVPEWIHRYDGRPKYLLREAERPLVTSTVADREDKAIWERPYVDGYERYESRAALGIASFGTVPGADAERAAQEIERFRGGLRAYPLLTWLPVSVGLWLHYLSVLQRNAGLADAALFEYPQERRAHAQAV